MDFACEPEVRAIDPNLKAKLLQMRQENVEKLRVEGFLGSPHLPLLTTETLRPLKDIALRLMALKALFLWVAAPEQAAPAAVIQESISKNDLTEAMTEKELEMFAVPRSTAHELHVNTVGWRLENMLMLAWVFGFEPTPALHDGMIKQETIDEILLNFTPRFRDGSANDLINMPDIRSPDEVLQAADLYYCCHNAVRSAQLGAATVPSTFDPIIDGGIIHERRHALFWCVSPGVNWEDTDLST